MKKTLVACCAFFFANSLPAQVAPAGSAAVANFAPENLGLGLRQLAILQEQDQPASQEKINSSRGTTSDSAGRVLVNINLNGVSSADDVSAGLVGLQAQVTTVETAWRHGVISAFLAIEQASAVAKLPGVQSVLLAPRPIRRVGRVTAESSVVEHAREVNTPGTVTAQGLLGRGISVGIVSDSYDAAPTVPRASAGVLSGDLPGFGNPDGYAQPVIVLAEGSGASLNDEGRAMAEIVHDIAPAAKICFSAAGGTQAAMAASIRNLRTNSQARCDVIVDDIAFADEPFFSDGIIAQAVEDVVTNGALAGKKVSYFSASGNNVGGYSADANIISFATANAHRGNINFSQVPAPLYAGGIHNLGSAAAPVIAMTVTTGSDPSHTLGFQWDDPFNRASVTTDYNLLVFSATGQYLSSLSGTDMNQATDEPLEIVNLAASTTYQLVIALRTNAPPLARHLRLLSADGGEFTGPYISSDAITLFGHAAAASANCIAAYQYNRAPETVTDYNPAMLNPPPGPYEPALESFNAVGGSLPFYFNAQGQRLSEPEIRLKPDFAAADGVDTSFFPTDANADYDHDGFPNFFGTSAAAPNAAAFAALLLEAAGGPASLSPAQVHSFLQQATSAHDLDPGASVASVTSGSISLQVTATGDESNASADSPTFFTVTFNGQPGERLNELTIDLTNTSLVFDPSADLGFPFTVGQNTGNIAISSSLSEDNRAVTLTFGNTFTAGKSISFGLDRDLAGINVGGNSADLLGGASVTAVSGAGTKLFAAFANQLGSAFVPREGYGFLDARTAVEKIVGKNSSAAGVPVNLSTRGLVGSGDDVLIGGVIINGTATKRIVVRAVGPSLPVPGALADPTLELFDSNGQKFATNDNWQDDPDQAAQIAASDVAPTDARESALLETLNAGAYTAIVRGAVGSTGLALVEFYDLESAPAPSHLANISTRGEVRTENGILIAGFILRNGPAQVVVRAGGPSLASSGVSGFLADPSLELHDGQGNTLMTNDNWQQNGYEAMRLQTVGLAPANAVDSAGTMTLNPGAYTILVRGAHETTGVALVEVYDLQ